MFALVGKNLFSLISVRVPLRQPSKENQGNVKWSKKEDSKKCMCSMRSTLHFVHLQNGNFLSQNFTWSRSSIILFSKASMWNLWACTSLSKIETFRNEKQTCVLYSFFPSSKFNSQMWILFTYLTGQSHFRHTGTKYIKEPEALLICTLEHCFRQPNRSLFHPIQSAKLNSEISMRQNMSWNYNLRYNRETEIAMNYSILKG